MYSLNSHDPMIDVGFGNLVPKNRIVGIVAYDSDPLRRQCAEMEKMHRVIDATRGRKVKSVIFLDSSHVVLSSVARETLAERLIGIDRPDSHDKTHSV